MKLKKIILKKTNSTNDVAIRQIRKGTRNGIIISESQTSGRGRYGKKWISIKGNLFLSIFFEIKKNTLIKKITKTNCLLIKKVLKKLTFEKITIKPPNDLLIKKQKVCGILQETIVYNKRKFIVVGVGINITQSPIINNYPTSYINKYSKNKINKYSIFANIKKTYEKSLTGNLI